MNKRRTVALGTLVAIVLAVAWSAWTWWPPVLRFRLRQINQRTDRVVIEYLDGKRELASAAQTLADLWDTAMSIAQHLPAVGQTARIEDPGPGALGKRAPLDERDGQRLRELLDSASRTSRSRAGWTMYRSERDST